MPTDRNLLFGALAMQAGLIDSSQFTEVCLDWVRRPDTSLADLLEQRGGITPTARARVELLLELRLKQGAENPLDSLGAVADQKVRRVLDALADPRSDGP